MAYVFLDDAQNPTGENWLFANPARIITAHTPEEVEPALVALQSALNEGYYAAGFFSYELGYIMDDATTHLLPTNRTVPLLWFALDKSPQNTRWEDAPQTYTAGTPAPALDASAYTKKCEHVLQRILAGEVYQTNLTFKAHFNFEGSATGFYNDLRKRQPSSYGALIDTGNIQILSLSPELFFRREGNTLTVKPMKGTAQRGLWPDDDAREKQMLATDPKQRAENLMIVDLMRNDLGRIAKAGSVKVNSLFDVETYKTLHQMTSHITANLNANKTLRDVLAALFPCGSITGAPKISAMNIIHALEDTPRGVYCGAIGILKPNGDACFNVGIRTITIQCNRAEIGIGSGVVADSIPADEYAECLLKMKFLAPSQQAYDLFETLLWDNGYTLLDRHLARLQSSATFLGYMCDIDVAKAALQNAQKEFVRPQMVKLTLKPDGTCIVTSKPITPSDAPMRFKLSETRIHSGTKTLYHKTTDRVFYDTQHAQSGVDEVVFANERGEITEGSRMNIFIEKDGKLITPPVHCGLLPGTLRAEMLENGTCIESIITINDLEQAQTIYLGNSVRGLRLGHLVR